VRVRCEQVPKRRRRCRHKKLEEVLEWTLTWGEREDGLQAVEDQTGETPKALRDKPKPHPWVAWYYEAFWLLDSARPVYQGSVGRIPMSEIAAYFYVFEILGTESRQLFIRTIRALDSVYVKLTNERIKREIDQERKKTGADSGR